MKRLHINDVFSLGEPAFMYDHELLDCEGDPVIDTLHDGDMVAELLNWAIENYPYADIDPITREPKDDCGEPGCEACAAWKRQQDGE